MNIVIIGAGIGGIIIANLFSSKLDRKKEKDENFVF